MISLELLLEISVVLIVLSSIYWIIKNRMSFSARRITILLIPAFSLVVVLLQFVLSKDYSIAHIPIVEADAVVVSSKEAVAGSFISGWFEYYVLGAFIMVLVLLFKVARLLYFFRNASPLLSNRSVRVLVTNDKNSFSFFNLIHLSAHLGEDERKVVLEHELLHHNRFHSLDLVLINLYHILFWFNPVMILLKRELIQTHEYEVDEAMYSKYDEAYLGHLLSYAFGSSVAHLLLTSQFYTKMTLAKRIKKMKIKNKTNRFAVLIIPVLGLSLGLISWTYTGESTGFISDFTNHQKPGDGELDKKPEFKGGQEALIQFMVENVNYPEQAKKESIEGTVYVTFFVETTGQLTEVKVEKGVHKLLDAEALRVVKSMPDWLPGEKNNKKVKAQMTLPITFKLT